VARRVGKTCSESEEELGVDVKQFDSFGRTVECDLEEKDLSEIRRLGIGQGRRGAGGNLNQVQTKSSGRKGRKREGSGKILSIRKRETGDTEPGAFGYAVGVVIDKQGSQTMRPQRR